MMTSSVSSMKLTLPRACYAQTTGFWLSIELLLLNYTLTSLPQPTFKKKQIPWEFGFSHRDILSQMQSSL